MMMFAITLWMGRQSRMAGVRARPAQSLSTGDL